MFDDLVISSAHPKRTNKPWTVTLSFFIQAVIVGVFILIPLICDRSAAEADADYFSCRSSSTSAASSAR